MIIAASHLDAVTFQICSQSFKIMPTAIFAVWLLGQMLTPMQWASLPVLALGVVFVTLNTSTPKAAGSTHHDLLLLGLGASALSGLSSAYAGAPFTMWHWVLPAALAPWTSKTVISSTKLLQGLTRTTFGLLDKGLVLYRKIEKAAGLNLNCGGVQAYTLRSTSRASRGRRCGSAICSSASMASRCPLRIASSRMAGVLLSSNLQLSRWVHLLNVVIEVQNNKRS